MNYQVMPDLSPEEFEVLKQDIAKSGVLVPVEYDENGNILDGHHRVRACAELGIKEWPSVVRVGFTEEQKRTHARRLNLNRRHLTQEQKRELIRQQLIETPAISDRQIARDLGVDNKTVGVQRKELESTEEIPQLTETMGADGKVRPRYIEKEAQEVQPSPTTDQVESSPKASAPSISQTTSVFLPTNKGMEKAVQKEIKKSNPGTHVILSSESNEWYTPAKYIEAVRLVMGLIELDPASCDAANKTVKAEVYYSKEDNGLGKVWFGKVFCNPPYGGLSGPFSAKLIDEYKAGNVSEAILLVNANSTDTQWFYPLWDYTLCFTNHRIDFISPEAKENNSTHGSVFVYLGENSGKFASIFSQFGAVVERYKP